MQAPWRLSWKALLKKCCLLLCGGRCPDAVAAKDLVQEVLLVAIRRADHYQVERPVLLWMLDILDEQVRKSQ